METKNLQQPSFLAPDAPPKRNGYHDTRYQDSPGNAEIERLITKVDTLRNGNRQQVIMITSALLGEGKSTIATRIAQTTARKRGPTLLIDFDLRRPRLHRIFDVLRGNGVVDIMHLDAPLRRCVKETRIPNLYLLTSGVVRENPIELLNIERVQRLLNEACEHFDHIIVDAPPIIPVSDPLLIGKVVDNVLLVIKAGETSRHVIKRAIDMFFDIKVEISGIVLNNMKNVLPHYFDHDYYGYKYYEASENIRLE